MKMVHEKYSTLLTEFSTALTTILPILFQYCYKCCYSDNRNLWTVMKVGDLAPWNLIQPNISLEMPVPNQGHCDFPNFPVVDWFCMFVDLWVFTFPFEDYPYLLNFLDITTVSILHVNLTVFFVNVWLFVYTFSL